MRRPDHLDPDHREIAGARPEDPPSSATYHHRHRPIVVAAEATIGHVWTSVGVFGWEIPTVIITQSSHGSSRIYNANDGSMDARKYSVLYVEHCWMIDI
jgi:hypothetical protein